MYSSTHASSFERPRISAPGIALIVATASLLLFTPCSRAQSYTWGTTLISGSTWLGGSGVNVYWNGTPTCNPNYVGGNSYTTYNGTQYYTGEEFQCGELPFRLYTTKGWFLGVWPDTYAYQMYTAPPAGMTTHANGSGYLPVPGDCVVWNAASDTDSAGHVAVVNYIDGSHVYICEQNMCNYGSSILDRSGTGGSFFTREDGWGAGALLGCVHCNNNTYSYNNPHINPCVATTSDGREEVFAIGHTGQLYHDYQTTPGGSWSGWTGMGTTNNVWTQNGLPCGGVNKDGRLEVFIVGTDGSVNHIYQKVAGSSAMTNWSSFSVVSSSYVSQTAKLAVGKWANGSLDLFVIGTDGVLYHNYQTSGGWSGFTSLGGNWPQDADIAVGSELDERAEVFLIGSTGNLYNNWQTSANGTNWNGWSDLGGAVAEQVRLAFGRNSDGRLEIFTLGTDGVAYHDWETAANSPTSWNGWASLGGNWETDAKPIVAADQNGALEVFVIGHTGNVYHNYEATGGWSGWISLGGGFTQNIRPCVGQNQSGTLEVFLIGPGADMQHAWETSANSATWSSWGSLGGTWN